MSRKSLQVVLVIACLIFSASGVASGASIMGSKHDFSALSDGSSGLSKFAGAFQSAGEDITETCVFCHTPHNAAAVPAPGVTGLLWNRTNLASTSYTLYTSATLTSSVYNNMGSGPTGLTLMCMSCHDGITSIAIGTLINAPYSGTGSNDIQMSYGFTKDKIGQVYSPTFTNNFQWGVNIGNLTPSMGTTVADLSNDHPVSFAWVDNIPGINNPPWTGNGAALKLFGSARRMECSTCHDVHNPANPPFLRMSNSNSDMCTTCHSK